MPTGPWLKSPPFFLEIPMNNEQLPTSRRGFFWGAAAASAAVATVAGVKALDTAPLPSTESLPPAPPNGGGYSLSEHVKRYYQTTRV
jgi:hypothetical protein